PHSVESLRATEDSVTLCWLAPTAGRVQGYLVRFRESLQDLISRELNLTAQSLHRFKV
ncbi:unnamed protein product, partial [Darwinula stevensoni]